MLMYSDVDIHEAQIKIKAHSTSDNTGNLSVNLTMCGNEEIIMDAPTLEIDVAYTTLVKNTVEISRDEQEAFFNSSRGAICPILSVDLVRKNTDGQMIKGNFAIAGKSIISFDKATRSIVIDSKQVTANSTYDQFFIQA